MNNKPHDTSLEEAKQQFRLAWQKAARAPAEVVRETTRKHPLATLALAGVAGFFAERGIPAALRALKGNPAWALILAEQLIRTSKD